MLSQILSPENYRFTIYALPMLIAGVAILIPGFLVLFQAGRSRVGASYFLLCLTISLYMASSALNNASIDVRLSLLWTKVGNIGVIVIPSSVLLLTALLFGLGRRYRSAIAASIGLSVFFMLGLFLTDLYIRRIELFPWGHWGQYGPLGIAFIFYFIAIMALVLRIYWQAYRHCTTERQKKRYRGLLTAFIGGYLGSVDFLPSLGIPVYPFGYLSVGFFIVVSTYVIIRYRLVDITPELAAGQILETMQSAVIVADLDGRIRVINRVALDMIGLTRAEVLGGDLATVIPIPAELGDAVRSGERVTSREMIWQGRTGRYDVSLSASLLTDMQDNDPVGFVYVATDITERKRMEGTLRTGEERLRLALSAANQGWFDLNVQTGEVVVSPEYAIMLGYDPASFATSLQTWINDIHDDDRPLVLKEYRECLANGGPRTMEYRRRTKTNEWKWISSIGKIFEHDAERKPLRMIGIHTDVTERRRFMEVCRESEERFRALVESTHDWIWEVDENARYTYASPRIRALLGYEPHEVIGRSPFDLMTPEEARRVAEDFSAKAKARLPLIGLEKANLHKDGHPVMLETSGVPVIDAEGRFKGYRGIDRDITNRKQAEEKIQQLVHEQQIILDTLAIGVIFVKKRIVLWANPAFRTMFGFSQLEAEGMEGRRLYADSRDYERVGREGYALIATGESYTTEATSLKRDGSTFWIRLTGRAVNPERPAEGSIWMLQDITDQKRSEEALRQSEEKYRLLVEAANSVILTWDTESRILFLNEYGERFFGFAKNELMGRNIIGTIVPETESSGRDLQLLMQAIRNAPDQFKDNENENITRDGRRVWVRWANKAILDGQGNLTGILSIGNDITARRQAEAALWEKTRQLEILNRTLEERVEEEVAIRTRGEQVLLQQSKLAAMGEMLGAIAHQWRQPLNALGMVVQNIDDASKHGDLSRGYIEHAIQKSMVQIRHMSKTIDDFRNFYRPEKELSSFETIQALGNVLRLVLAQLISYNIGFRLTCASHKRSVSELEDIMPCPESLVQGYQNEYEHVLMNLINNARDAILERRVRESPADPEQGLLIFEFSSAGGKVILDVGDNGGGIPGDILGRIFEPYFTTKDPAKGTGLGLYMSKVIIEDHMQGKLTARNSAQGAVVRIELPQAAEGAPHD